MIAACTVAAGYPQPLREKSTVSRYSIADERTLANDCVAISNSSFVGTTSTCTGAPRAVRLTTSFGPRVEAFLPASMAIPRVPDQRTQPPAQLRRSHRPRR